MVKTNLKYQKIKTMKNIMILFCLIIPFLSLAQEAGYQQFQQGKTYHLLADKVNIRSTASTSGSIVATLPIATQVTFERWNSSQLTIGGYTAKWAKISFIHPTKNQKVIGYVWGGFISESLIKSKANPSLSFVYGISKVKKDEDHGETVILQMRVVKNKTEIDRIIFKAVGPVHINHSGTTLGDRGVKGIKEIVMLDFSQEMCGGAFGQVVLFWDGQKMHHAKLLRDGADAPFYWEESLVYPNDKGGKPNRIIFKTEEGGENDNGQEYSEVKTYDYYWTGTKLEKINK